MRTVSANIPSYVILRPLSFFSLIRPIFSLKKKSLFVGISIGALSFWVNSYRSLISPLTDHILRFDLFNAKLQINSGFNFVNGKISISKMNYVDKN